MTEDSRWWNRPTETNDPRPDEKLQEVWIVWVKEGKYGDQDITVARSTFKLAVEWCDRHAKAHQALPIEWDNDEGVAGEGRYFYSLELIPFQ